MSLELSGTNKVVFDNLNANIKDLLTPKNWIINGGFDVWQRGTSQTNSGYGSADRWNNAHYGSSKTNSQQAFTVGQTSVPNNPTYFSRTVVTSGGTADYVCIKYQKIEDVTKLSGKTVTVSFWAKADASKNLSVEFGQDFGTGGSAQVNQLGVQKFALTTAWQRFTKTVTLPSVSGKTIGVGNFTFLMFWFDAGSNFNANTDSLGNQSGTFDIANVSLVEGSTPVEWQTEAYADVLRQCQRYYIKFQEDSHSVFALGSVNNYSLTTQTLNVYLPVQMRIKPTSVEYSGALRVHDTTTEFTVSSLAISNNQSSKNIVCITSTTTVSMTGYRPSFLGAKSDANAYIAFSAEL